MQTNNKLWARGRGIRTINNCLPLLPPLPLFLSFCFLLDNITQNPAQRYNLCTYVYLHSALPRSNFCFLICYFRWFLDMPSGIIEPLSWCSAAASSKEARFFPLQTSLTLIPLHFTQAEEAKSFSGGKMRSNGSLQNMARADYRDLR